MPGEVSNRRPKGRGARRPADAPVNAADGAEATLMLDGRHYVVTGPKAMGLRSALAPYIAAARTV